MLRAKDVNGGMIQSFLIFLMGPKVYMWLLANAHLQNKL